MQFKSFSNYLVEESSEIYFTFGRFNPPTSGHELLLKKLAKYAGNKPYKVYLSHSQDAKKNPLSYTDKIKMSRKMFPRYARNIIAASSKFNNVFSIVTNLYDAGHQSISMVVGSDRVKEFKILLNKYNGVKGRHGIYKFKNIEVLSAGERDPDADDVTGMSASKMRAAAANNDFISFASGVTSALSDADTKTLFNLVRKGMGLKEQKAFRQHVDIPTVSDIREKYVKGLLYNLGDKVLIKESDTLGIVDKLGTNYIIVKLNNGSTESKWLEDVELITI
jgi:hypothetical protein